MFLILYSNSTASIRYTLPESQKSLTKCERKWITDACAIRYGINCFVAFIQAKGDISLKDSGLWAAHQYTEARLCVSNEPFQDYEETTEVALKKIKYILIQKRLIRFHEIEVEEEPMPQTKTNIDRSSTHMDKPWNIIPPTSADDDDDDDLNSSESESESASESD